MKYTPKFHERVEYHLARIKVEEKWGTNVKLNTKWAAVPVGVVYLDCQQDTYAQNTQFDHDAMWVHYWNNR